jgi:hypothetical protein
MISTVPLFEKLKNAQNILLVGAGGGFDIYASIPLLVGLQNQNKNIILANYAFTFLKATDSTEVFPYCWEVNSCLKEDNPSYFPEKFLKIGLEKNNINVPLYAFEKVGVQPLKTAYNYLIDKHQIDAIVLIDGGTDSLMFGDEPSLGTPHEDICSVKAVSETNVDTKLLACLGFGIDHFHGVEHYYFLRNVALLSKKNAFYGTFSILPNSQEANLFNDIVQYSNEEMFTSPSIVNNSINDAIQGEFGNFHSTFKTQGSELWINPLMSIYWTFDLMAVSRNMKYSAELNFTHTMKEVDQVIRKLREKIEIQEHKNIPL